jgi:multicomponent K+:H+ antiporter subunit D
MSHFAVWEHLIMVPIILPLMTGALLQLVQGRWPGAVAWMSNASAVLGLGVAVLLLAQAETGKVQAYLVGNWAAPFGISLALDRLSALMVLLTWLVGVAAMVYASGGDAQRGRHFYSLMQFQLMGLSGAFLTADLFNLFVFFEVLLIASYGLLLHGAGTARLKASVHYVSFNLAGSALFLIAVSLLYGLTGTLNMADLAQRVPLVAGDRTQLVQSAALLLLVVFAVKAALLPLYFWLPATYGAASAPVAALFAIMTKVGVYAILRVTTLIFGASGGAAAFVASPWLEALALGTLLLGAIGAVAAPSPRALVGNVVVASAGTLLLAVGLGRPDTVGAGLFYLVNSTLVAAALFLWADRVIAARGHAGADSGSDSGTYSADSWAPADLGTARVSLGVVFFVLAIAAAGMPPLAGFLGKAMLLQAVGQTPWAVVIVATILTSSLLVMVAFSRAGSALFWKPGVAVTPLIKVKDKGKSIGKGKAVAAAPALTTWHSGQALSLGSLLVLLLICAAFAGPLARYTAATADQLLARQPFIAAVLGAKPVPAAIDVRKEMNEQKREQLRDTAGAKP